jgi:hypothetical protein
MSGKSDRDGPVAPLDFTDEEVRLLAGRRSKPVAAVARLRKLVPTNPIGKLASDRKGPAQITRKELPLLRRAGKRPQKILKRLTPSDLPADQVEPRKDQRLIGPKKKLPVD